MRVNQWGRAAFRLYLSTGCAAFIHWFIDVLCDKAVKNDGVNRAMLKLSRIFVGFAAGAMAVSLSACGGSLGGSGMAPLTRDDARSVIRQINPRVDPNLDEPGIRRFLSNSTVVTVSIGNTAQRQYGYFSNLGNLQVNPRTGTVVDGRWRADGDTLCYEFGPDRFCSHIKSADVVLPDGTSTRALYFVREDTFEPTVLVVSTDTGFGIPDSRL